MSSDDYQVRNIYKYSRKSYKNNYKREAHENGIRPQDDTDNLDSNHSPRNEEVAMDLRKEKVTMDLPGCSCDLDHDGDIASILHKKCPVITLAHRQLQRLLEDSDKMPRDHYEHGTIHHLLRKCLEILQSNGICALLFLLGLSFFSGLLFGAASCGSYLGQFNSPLLTCLDNFFMSESYSNKDEFRGVV